MVVKQVKPKTILIEHTLEGGETTPFDDYKDVAGFLRKFESGEYSLIHIPPSACQLSGAGLRICDIIENLRAEGLDINDNEEDTGSEYGCTVLCFRKTYPSEKYLMVYKR